MRGSVRRIEGGIRLLLRMEVVVRRDWECGDGRGDEVDGRVIRSGGYAIEEGC